jgi:hypothetical protein
MSRPAVPQAQPSSRPSKAPGTSTFARNTEAVPGTHLTDANIDLQAAPSVNGSVISNDPQVHYNTFKSGRKASFTAGKRLEKDWSRKFFGIAYQDLISV